MIDYPERLIELIPGAPERLAELRAAERRRAEAYAAAASASRRFADVSRVETHEGPRIAKDNVTAAAFDEARDARIEANLAADSAAKRAETAARKLSDHVRDSARAHRSQLAAELLGLDDAYRAAVAPLRDALHRRDELAALLSIESWRRRAASTEHDGGEVSAFRVLEAASTHFPREHVETLTEQEDAA